ncbi:MAG: AAA family ATPase [Candidatus Hydrothermarchaeales archaeon]
MFFLMMSLIYKIWQKVSSMTLKLAKAKDLMSSLKKEQTWLVNKLLVENSIFMLYGKRERGKSSLLMQLAHSFLNGDPFIGFPVEAKGPVLYLNLDMSKWEFKEVYDRATDFGLKLGDLIVPKELTTFDILSRRDREFLEGYCREAKPICLLVDTIGDGFYERKGSKEEVRHVIRYFQTAANPGCFGFTQHDRKQGGYVAFRTEGEPSEGEDEFSGFGSYEDTTATSIRIMKTKKEGFTINFMKQRTAPLGFTKLRVIKNDHGFFNPQIINNPGLLLLFWPDNVPKAKRNGAIEACTSVRSACKYLEGETGIAHETLRKVLTRGRERGVDYPLYKYVSKAD